MEREIQFRIAKSGFRLVKRNATKDCELKSPFGLEISTHGTFRRLQLIKHELGGLVTVTKMTESLYSKR